MTRILVTGATGFIGRRLVPALIEEGHEVRAMTRHPETYDGPGEPVAGDVHDAASLVEPLRGVDVAYYLVHSLDDADFERKDAEAAKAFATAAADQGVTQIVYMGGLGDDDGDMSAHLRSRREVEGLLGSSGIPVTVLRAAIVVGHGGISWELTRQLVKNLPAMVVPKWASTRTQPIAIDDVVRYLVGVGGREEALRPRLRDRRPRPADLRRHAPRRGRDREGPHGADHPGPGADTAAVVVLAGAGDRRRRHHRAQPDRLDGHRGGGHRAVHPRASVPGEPLGLRAEAGAPRRCDERRQQARGSAWVAACDRGWPWKIAGRA